MYQLRIRKLAQKDSNEIFEYYSNINSPLALKFLDALQNQLDVIAEHPELFQLKYKSTRVRI